MKTNLMMLPVVNTTQKCTIRLLERNAKQIILRDHPAFPKVAARAACLCDDRGLTIEVLAADVPAAGVMVRRLLTRDGTGISSTMQWTDAAWSALELLAYHASDMMDKCDEVREVEVHIVG